MEEEEEEDVRQYFFINRHFFEKCFRSLFLNFIIMTGAQITMNSSTMCILRDDMKISTFVLFKHKMRVKNKSIMKPSTKRRK